MRNVQALESYTRVTSWTSQQQFKHTGCDLFPCAWLPQLGNLMKTQNFSWLSYIKKKRHSISFVTDPVSHLMVFHMLPEFALKRLRNASRKVIKL